MTHCSLIETRNQRRKSQMDRKCKGKRRHKKYTIWRRDGHGAWRSL